MSIAPQPSYVFLPKKDIPYPSILEFLTSKFPNISEPVWRQRIIEGKISYKDEIITLNTQYKPNCHLQYYREVEKEIIIPYDEEILYQDDNIIVVDKPHFIPVTPSGNIVNESLIYRLKKKFKFEDIKTIHRLDMATAGVVMFSINNKTHNQYLNLFKERKIEKTYEAITHLPHNKNRKEWIIENEIVKSEECFFLMKIGNNGANNAKTFVRLKEKKDNKYLFELKPITGRKHQLRLHLSQITGGIINDRFYPTLLSEKKYDYNNPLQLLAKKLEFIDPITNKKMMFQSKKELRL